MNNLRYSFAAACTISLWGAISFSHAIELQRSPMIVDQAAHVLYNPSTGDVSFLSPNDPLASMDIESASSAFLLTDWCASWNLNCVGTSRKNAYFDSNGFADTAPLSLGPVLPSGMSYEDIIADVTVDGVRVAGGSIDSSPGRGPYLVFVVPEPSGGTLVGIGSILYLLLGRRRVVQSFRRYGR